jgi:hypothetical protein
LGIGVDEEMAEEGGGARVVQHHTTEEGGGVRHAQHVGETWGPRQQPGSQPAVTQAHRPRAGGHGRSKQRRWGADVRAPGHSAGLPGPVQSISKSI